MWVVWVRPPHASAISLSWDGFPSNFRPSKTHFELQRRRRSTLFRFILPAIREIRNDRETPTGFRNAPALDLFLRDRPLLLCASIHAWILARVVPLLEVPVLPDWAGAF